MADEASRVRFDLGGMRVLVVGASSGLGLEIAKQAHAGGARVALGARRLDRLEAEAKALGEGACAVRIDVRSQPDCDAGVRAGIDALGGLDAVIYASGMSPLVWIHEATPEQWQTVLETNVVGASFVTAACLDALRESGGRALYLSSYSVRQALPGMGLYSTSKIALDGLIEAWRGDHPDVQFTRVVVGNTLGTEFAAGWDAEAMKEITQIWVERNLFTSPTIMPIEYCGEAVVAALAARGYVDDVAIMPAPGQRGIFEHVEEELG